MLLIGACGLFAAGTARADVVYWYVGRSLVAAPYGPPFETSVFLDLTDAAVASGSFNLSGSGVPGDLGVPFLVGDGSGFVSLQSDVFGGKLTSSYIPDFNEFKISMTFDSAGNITSDSMTLYGPTQGDTLSGTGALTTGFIGSDDPRYDEFCATTSLGCPISGSWSQFNTGATFVPEPASIMLLAVGIAGTAAVRRRRS